MSSFSGWGPTDDGRIKPDIVTNGIGVYSTIVGGYASWDGTSMAAPAATGSILLLQEHYAQLHSTDLMRSATARALVIHSADEAGLADGPDYQHGWGLMNTAKAAKLISQDYDVPEIIQELVLLPGDTFSFEFQYSGQFDPFIKATIAWTDPPGTPVSPQVDPTDLMLVNDLDLRIQQIGPSEAEFYPWILDPANPAAPASKADNFRDNVEVAHLANPVPGAKYRVVVSHKGSLHNNLPQHFSLVLSGLDLPSTTSAPLAVNAGIAVRSFPNPAVDHFDLQFFNAEKLGSVSLEIFTIEGKPVHQEQFTASSQTRRILTENWPTGMYLYKVSSTAEGSATGKFLIVR
jgi:hypothetical protein